jgi:hypothetical protein
MKRFLLLFLLFQSWLGFAQKIENVHSEQDGNNINIYYDLLTKKSTEVFNITVYCSTNGGKTFGNSLIGVSGDIGNNITPGKNKKIVWNVLQDMKELSGDIVFNVKAEVVPSQIKDTINKNQDLVKKKILVVASLGFGSSGGLMVGIFKKKGLYLSYRTSAIFEKSGLEANNSSILNYDRQDQYYLFINETKHQRLSICIGGIYQFAKKFYAFTGVGFGLSSLYWKIEDRNLDDGKIVDNRWVKNTTWSKKGLEWEGGVFFKNKWFVANAGFTTLWFDRSYIFLGLGVAL